MASQDIKNMQSDSSEALIRYRRHGGKNTDTKQKLASDKAGDNPTSVEPFTDKRIFVTDASRKTNSCVSGDDATIDRTMVEEEVIVNDGPTAQFMRDQVYHKEEAIVEFEECSDDKN